MKWLWSKKKTERAAITLSYKHTHSALHGPPSLFSVLTSVFFSCALDRLLETRRGRQSQEASALRWIFKINADEGTNISFSRFFALCFYWHADFVNKWVNKWCRRFFVSPPQSETGWIRLVALVGSLDRCLVQWEVVDLELVHVAFEKVCWPVN